MLEYWDQFDRWLVDILKLNSFTSNLIITPASKFITEILFIAFILVLSYEIMYWSGICIGLWEYHAKEIFKEIPIHCAHVYVRLNAVDAKDLEKLHEYYNMKQDCKYNLLRWKDLNEQGGRLFKLKKFIRYHFEFSPEDFEMNETPEFGSTIGHLRSKILQLFEKSNIYQEYHDKSYNTRHILIFNNNDEEISYEQDLNYLSKLQIETGQVIDCIVIN